MAHALSTRVPVDVNGIPARFKVEAPTNLKQIAGVESSLAIANELVDLAHKKGRVITPMQLLKQVYYAHGWYLALADKPLIDEAIEAWQFGPVPPSVYHAFKHFKGDPITSLAEDIDWDRSVFVAPRVCSTDTNLHRFLEKISDTYGPLSGVQLSNLTHQPDSPWYEVWNHGGGKERKGEDIPDSKIKDFFCKRLRKSPQAATT